MSSEIRAGNNRTYWIISNGNSYVDGVTDPDLVTTVGNGWHVYWIGSDYAEYLNSCNSVNIIPRNQNPDVPTASLLLNDKLSARQIRLWLIQNGVSLQNVIDAINEIEDATLRESLMVEWEYAPYVERNHQMLPAIAEQLGFTEFDIDRAFTEGSIL